MSDPVVEHVLGRVRRDGDHMFWDTTRGRFMFGGQTYRVKAVLNGRSPNKGYSWRPECGERDCINPAHCVETPTGRYGKRPGPVGARHSNCLRCERAMRAHGAAKADFPHTVAQGARGLCQACHRRSSTGRVSSHLRMKFMSPYTQGLWDSLIPGGDEFEFDPSVVQRNVPQDLWGYFGVR